jgi:hypothetical protein
MKSNIGMMMAMASMFATGSEYEHGSRVREELRKPKEITEDDIRKQNIKRGLKQFFIEGEEVWAINYKRAVKKAKKLKTDQ